MKYDEEMLLYHFMLSMLGTSVAAFVTSTILLISIGIGLLNMSIYLLGLLYILAVPTLLGSYYWFVSAA
jgi:hypothetical protein